MNRTIPMALAVALALSACSDAAGPGEGGDADRRLRSVWDGDLANTDAALGASGTLAAATQVDAVEDAGSGSAQVIGSANVEADGSFTIDLRGAHDDVMFQARDASGAVIGAIYVGAVNAAATGRHTFEITAETTVEAMVWAEAQASHGSERVISAVDIRARVDASVAAAIQAEDDASA
ncbi:MAG TPA: hypothetical protein PKA64_14380, partial [Myxococcota bacterium]|nr:hypothetical protein [Myxococcota bacterium]